MGAGPSHAVDLAQRLIRCPSVTPHEGGALDLLEAEPVSYTHLTLPTKASV